MVTKAMNDCDWTALCSQEQPQPMMQLLNTENITSTMGTISNSLLSHQRQIQALPEGAQTQKRGRQPIICCIKREKIGRWVRV